MFEDLTFRPARAGDYEFLFGLYIDRRSGEFAALGWSDSEVETFLKMQFAMRGKAYEMRHPRAEHRIIQSDEVAVGEMIVDRAEKNLALVDISISTEFRGRGVGAEAVRRLQKEAEDENLPVTLHVDRVNLDAQRLYQRLGFVVTSDSDQVSIKMKWTENPTRN